ncbi:MULTISPECIES: polyphosphate--glucose phosphotransferase [Streptomyces]|uniref:polyphosphate--glucose phosphotransferase n=1 Tax=Streptomyces TaxID=1883 RepID=UPI00196438DF|nr:MULTISPECIES: ROK family protein [Streptomyces]QRX94083.1 ROK family protein [Streptomyces noursei]UJB43801.1 ROK family protein [Streptomyces sp. A1-5]
MRVFGVDIGGSGIKGAPVDLERGELVDERYKVLTPHPATPEAVADCVKEVVDHFGWTGPVGATFPGVVTGGTTRTAANVDKRWIGTDAAALLTGRLGGDTGGSPVTLLNDADAAGLAEMQFGAGRGRTGTVIVLTFGTGIGSAVFIDGRLVPNTELGHLELHGHDAEKRASTKAKEDEELNWQQWAHRVQKYLAHVEMLFSPALFVIGGGVSRKAEKFLPLIEGIRAEIVPARLQNNAGIVGAAMAARPPSAAGSTGAAQAAPATGAPPAAGGSPAGNGPGPAARTRPAQGPTPADRAPSAAVDSPVGWPDGRR